MELDSHSGGYEEFCLPGRHCSLAETLENRQHRILPVPESRIYTQGDAVHTSAVLRSHFM
jgi:hypothetical protein